jgi:predicted DNA-binding protein with PD1-like motif
MLFSLIRTDEETIMNFKLLNHDNGIRTYVVVFDEGDELMELLKGFAETQELTAASLSAIGAFQQATLGFFNMESKEYEKIQIDEQVEVLSLLGNIAMLAEEDKPKIHAHVVVGKRDGTALGGHLISATVRPTLEVVVTETPLYLQRREDKKTGLALIDIADTHVAAHTQS